MRLPLLIVVLCALKTYAHFSIISPAARQVVVGRGITPDFGGPGDVNGNNANIPGGAGETKFKADFFGQCGDDGRRRAFELPKFAEIFGAQFAQPQATLVANEIFEVQMRVTANHLGWLEARYCETGVDNAACFKRKLLRLAPPERQFKTGTTTPYSQNDFPPGDNRHALDFEGLPTASYRFRQTKCQNGAPSGNCCDPEEQCSSEKENVHRWMFPRSGAGTTDGKGGEIFSAHFYAPAITCNRCTIQFTWVTQNSPDTWPEVFWNCVDVRVVSDGSGTVVPPPATPPPVATNSPTKAPTNAPVTPSPVNNPPPPTKAPTQPPVAIPGLPEAEAADRDKRFNIQLIFKGASEQHQAAFTAAAKRWEEIIVKDTGSTVTFRAGQAICNQEPFAADTLVDDLLIFIQVHPIDGENKVRSNSGGCVFDTSNRVRVGIIIFDVADADALISRNLFNMAALHEIGHVLGLGNEWEKRNLISPRTDPGIPTYIGAFGSAGHGEIEGSGRALIHGITDNGQEDRRHWEGTVYRDELMSPELAVNKPISLLTVRALQDLGYGVDLSKADKFSVRNAPAPPPPGPQPTVPPSTPPPTQPTNAPTLAPTVAQPPVGSGIDTSVNGRIQFLQNNLAVMNNAARVPLNQPEVVPANPRVRTAAEGCAEAVDGFICIDLARNVRCVNGQVSKNFVNPFSENELIKACVGGFCGGSPQNAPPGGNKCVGTAQQAVAGMLAGNEFFLPPPTPPSGRRLRGEAMDEMALNEISLARNLQDPSAFMDPSLVADDPDAWHTPWKGVALTNVEVDPKPASSGGSNAGAVAGGLIGALVLVGAIAFVVMNRRNSTSRSGSTGKTVDPNRDEATSPNPMFTTGYGQQQQYQQSGHYSQQQYGYPMTAYNSGGYQ